MKALPFSAPAGPVFSGFPSDLFVFLKDLSAHNNRDWFRKNYDRYQTSLILPVKSCIFALGEFARMLNPRFMTEPKFNKTIMRISKDMRFTKGNPYRDFLLAGFKRWKGDSELCLYFDRTGLEIGIFLNNKKQEDVPSLRRILRRDPAVLDSVTREYELAGRYQLQKFTSEPETIYKRFDPSLHTDTLAGLDYILLNTHYAAASVVRSKEAILGTIIEHFSRLYPLWILSESADPIDELDRHSRTLGPVRKK